ncbi:premnaspirodiene oxygenase-like [Euphorbia lathyris]|uniref:premnaspirodiene oxygenase-like n=1 Tax=Euphorbia lathyris TaxID=212925 RepID=UPI0033140010
MELQLPSFPVLLTFLVFIFLVSRIRKKNSAKNLPPGPWKLPLIGSIHHLITSLPHHRLKDLAKIYGPIMHLQLGELSHIVISSPETAKEVMKTHDITFAQRPLLLQLALPTYNYSDMVFAPYGDYWRQLRKICTIELLSVKRVESFRSIREEQLSKVITSISSTSSAGSPINFSRMVVSLLYSIVSRSAFGKIWEGEDTFIAALKDVAEAAGGFSLADLYPSIKLFQVLSVMSSKIEKHQKKVDQIFQSIIDQHRARKATGSNQAEGNEDLVDVLLNLQDQGDLQFPLTDDNIKAIILDIFSAGTETSSTTIDWAMSELMKNPRAMEKAQEEVRRIFGTQGNVDESRLDELNYLKLVIKETLRLHPPVPLLLPRECREECSIYGYEIPVKSKVMVNVWAMGRDPNYWNEAEKFNPERFIDSSIDYKGTNFEYLPFGAGRRMCPGITYGMINVEFPLAQLLFHFDWKLPTGMTPENLDMVEIFGIVTKRKNDLHLIPIPYRPSHVK